MKGSALIMCNFTAALCGDKCFTFKQIEIGLYSKNKNNERFFQDFYSTCNTTRLKEHFHSTFSIMSLSYYVTVVSFMILPAHY